MFLFLFLHRICFGYLLESPRRGDSNKYPKHMLFEILKNIAPAKFLNSCHLLSEGFRAKLSI